MQPEPRATYRVQMRQGFGFDEVTALIPYLVELGVSHLYASPYLQAVAGSSHGYDLVDPTRVNEELGGSAAHALMCQALLKAGLGQMIDIVPNHMAIASGDNPWWWDVLENGPSSSYAPYFDIDWESSQLRWPNKVLLPVLGDHYGRILEDGQLQLVRDKETLLLQYHDHHFPVDPSSLADLLTRAASACGSEVLAFLAESYARLPRSTTTAQPELEQRHRDRSILRALLLRLWREDPLVVAAIDAEVDRINRSPDELDSFINQQNYRLALWRTASHDLGYRRFFNIQEMAGLRVEEMEVFRAAHALPLSWVDKGWVQGLRIDHPDGLHDPGEYFRRLREAAPDAWIVAEKILEPGEQLRPSWPIEGTTGYDYLNLAGGLFIDAKAEEPLTNLYAEMTGEQTDFSILRPICKRLVLTQLLASELNRLASLFVSVCELHRRHRDYTRHELKEALCETAAFFPVYRSYVSTADGRLGKEDQEVISSAIQEARRYRPDLDPELFTFLQDLLLLRFPGAQEAELAMRFQQLTGPAMAKGVEDTALYRYYRLVSLNEVGGDPSWFGVSPAVFHQTCLQAEKQQPLSLLASTTHDTKRSEDLRARLALLTEIPDSWATAVYRWSAHNDQYRKDDEPDRNTEYLLYQTLVGTWPSKSPRIVAYMEKAVREAKVHSSWSAPNKPYERNLSTFIKAILDDPLFCADLERFVTPLLSPGWINGLAQTLIKLTAPGIPDIYRGTELWDLSLVDPDNRRSVDFGLRRSLLAEVATLTPAAIMTRMEEGLPKLWLIRQTLHLRRDRPALFSPGSGYRPLLARGIKADNVLAFVRGEGAITVAPRLTIGLAGDWGGTVLDLPPGGWHNLLTGEALAGHTVSLQGLFASFPVALLVRNED